MGGVSGKFSKLVANLFTFATNLEIWWQNRFFWWQTGGKLVANMQHKKRKLSRIAIRRLRNLARLVTVALLIALMWFTWTRAESDIIAAWNTHLQPYVMSLFFVENYSGVEYINTPTNTIATTASATTTATNIFPTITPTKIIVATDWINHVMPIDVVIKVKTGVDKGNLNLRTGPGIRFPVISVLKEGQELLFIECNGEWVEVSDGINHGFVYNAYIENNQCQ